MSLEDPPRERLEALTPLRFIASLGVLLSHSMGFFLPRPEDPPPGSPGEWWRGILHDFHSTPRVTFFFVLSGFVLYYAYGALRREKVARFLWRRGARIVPMFLLGFALILVIELLTPGEWAKTLKKMGDLPGGYPLAVATNLFLLQAWVPIGGYNLSVNGPAWAASAEIAFYLLFPLLAWKLKGTWWWKLPLCAVPGILLIGLANHWQVEPVRGSVDPRVTQQSLLLYHPLARLPDFLAGVIACALFLRFLPLLRRTPRWLATALEVLALVLIFQATPLLQPLHQQVGLLLHRGLPDIDPRYSAFWVNGRSYLPLFALGIVIFAAGRGRLSRALRWKPLQAFGNISFAVYLLHIPVRDGLGLVLGKDSDFFGMDKPGHWNFWTYVALTVGLSFLARHCYELPLQRWLRQLDLPWQRRSTAAATAHSASPQDAGSLPNQSASTE